MNAARRARNERRAAARERIAQSSVVPDPASAARRAISGLLLRGIVLIILTVAGVLLAYGAYDMSPYSQASLPMLSRAIIAHAVFAVVYAWHVRTGSRFVPLIIASFAAAALLVYIWRMGSIPS